MKYAKPALTLDAQASLLASRGMGGGSDEIRRRLTQVNYYRLAAYWHPFRNDGEDTFRSGTTIRNVWRRYLFDRRLRLLTMDALERFEVTVRSRLAYHLACEYGPFGAYEGANLYRKDPKARASFLSNLYRDFGQNGDVFMEHFRSK